MPMAPGTLRCNIISESMAGATLVLLYSWNATVVSIAPAVIDSPGRSQELTNLVCSIGAMS
jgi:hypothetical protein